MISIIDRISNDLKLDQAYLISIISRSDYYYKKYNIPKHNGDQRVIYQASPELKTLQYWVRENVLRLLPISNAAFAYQPRSSIRKHAEYHIQASFLFHTDIKDFFPSIKARMLTSILISCKDSLQEAGCWYDDICEIVSKICFFKGVLTIGTVSSPMISNIVMNKIDEVLISYCKELGYRYSRYADDIYISSPNFLPVDVADAIKRVLDDNSFRINEQKTWFRSKKSQMRITGLTITDSGRISIGTENRNMIKGLIYNKLINGTGDADVILGYLAYLRDIEPKVYNNYMIKYSTYCNGDVISAIRGNKQQK